MAPNPADAPLTREGRQMGKVWSRYGSAQLDRYLIQEVEHPALNAQSVLMRSFLMDRLFPGRFHDLIERELYFSAVASFGLLALREGWFSQLRDALLSAGEDDIPGPDPALPGFLTVGFRPAPGFSVTGLMDQLLECSRQGFDQFKSPFEDEIRQALASSTAGEGGTPDRRPMVLELACGSANDFRFWHQFGFADRIDYCGVDVCPENIANARTRFPQHDFRVADACALPMADASADVVVAFDLYEHLSEQALEQAIAETARVSRDELWLSFFNAAPVSAHEFRPVDGYHWNLLSLDLLVRELALHDFQSQVVDVAAELSARFPGYRHHNEQAFVLLAGRLDPDQG